MTIPAHIRHLIVAGALFIEAPFNPSTGMMLLGLAVGVLNFVCAAEERAKGLWL